MTGDPKKCSFAEDKEGYKPGALFDVAPTVLALVASVGVVIDTDPNGARS